MKVSYELNDEFKLAELCEFILRIKKDGIVVIEYIINSDTNDLYFYAMDSCEKYKVIIDHNKLELTGFTATEALEYYNMALDCFDKE